MLINKHPKPIVVTRRVIFALFLRELKTRFGEYKLGVFWIFLDPLIQVAFFMLLFGYIFKRVMPNVDYTVYATTGILTWLMFKNVLTKGMAAIESNKGLLIFRIVETVLVINLGNSEEFLSLIKYFLLFFQS